MASEVGIRALKQNASAVVAQAAAGSTVTITEHGRPVARLVPIPTTELEGLTEAGQARPARRRMRDLPAPTKGPALSEILREQRDAERF
jgi:prevent-host-death family protein